MKLYKILIFIICVAVITSCQTTTRLGDALIPAHGSSYKSKGEEMVCLVFHEGSTVGQTSLAAVGSVVVPFIAGQATKVVADELRKEGKKYQKQYKIGRRVGLQSGLYKVFVFRLIEGNAPDGDIDSSKDLGALVKYVNDGGGDLPGYVSSAENLNEKIQLDKMKEKVVASAYQFTLTIEEQVEQSGKTYPMHPSVFKLDGIYFSKAKAKIVHFNWNPLQWTSALLLKTGETVDLGVKVKISNLSIKGGRKVVLDKSILDSQKVSIKGGDAKSYNELGDDLLLESLGEYVRLTMEFLITERDPSNVQKHINDSAEKVEGSSEGLAEAISNLVGISADE